MASRSYQISKSTFERFVQTFALIAGNDIAKIEKNYNLVVIVFFVILKLGTSGTLVLATWTRLRQRGEF
jgi:hypothetical protein